MEWIFLLYALEIGYMPYSQLSYHSDYYKTEDIMYVEFDSEIYLFDYIYIGGIASTKIVKENNGYNFFPFEVDYLFKAGIKWKYIEIGFQHLCSHPVAPYIYRYERDHNSYTDFNYEKIFIRISNEKELSR